MLRFWMSRIVTIKSVNNTQAKLGLVLEEEVTAPSVTKSDKRVEFGLGFSDELLRTSLMAVWELMRPSWCPSPNADSILRATQDVQSEKSYELLCKMFSAVPERTKEELESILGKKFMGYVSGNFSHFERQKQRGSTVTNYNAVDENDEVHRVMMEVEPLLEASGKRNWRSIMLTHDEFPCHCLLQTWWYPKRSNLMLIWDSGELLSMGLPDSSQPITKVIVGVMMAIRWLEAHVRENNRQEAPTREQLRKLDCLKDLDLFETMCKILIIPMEVKKIWARKRLMPWFRANMTAWLYEYVETRQSVQ